MVAVVVGLLLILGVIQVYLTTKQSYNAQAELARMQESGRFAMDLITRDLRRAGYWGGNVDTTTIEGDPGRFDPVANTCNNSDWARMVAWRVTGLNNGQAGYACAAGRIANADLLTIRYAGPEPTATIANDGTLYLRSTLFAGRLMRGDNEASNTLPPIGAGTPAHLLPQVRPLVAHAYYIANSTQTCNGAAIPALWRVRLLPGGTIAPEEIASGIEQLQVRFLENEDDGYVDADNVNSWPDVTAVRVWLLARSNCPEQGLGNAPTYQMADVPWPGTPDNFRRHLYVSTVMLRNTLVR
jgi:type IV pilus assembly protein PilW